MSHVFDRGAFDRAVTAFRFDEAERLLEAAPPSDRDVLRETLRLGRSRAEEAAQELFRRVVDLGTRDDYAGVLAVSRKASTRPLLDLLSETARHRVEVYVKAAERWEATGLQKNRRRLDEARRAIEQFDLELARGLVALLDERFLDDETAETRDRILLDIEARAMEMDSFRQAERRLTGERRSDRRPWWRRRKN